MFTASYIDPMFEYYCSNGRSSMEVAPNCPRCSSSNTKFCYYNNYSLSQPRYLCKACRRYWTKGGSLRNVPVGGGCRKKSRTKSAGLQRVSSNYGKPNEPFGSSHSSGDHDLVVQPTGSDTDIDLALVFAKFLNPPTESDQFVGDDQEGNAGTDSGGHRPAGPGPEETSLSGQVDVGGNGRKQREDEETSLFGLVNDELLIQSRSDSIWPEDSAINMTSFSWQSQDFSSFPVLHDHFNSIQPFNLANDNWNSFDLSGF